MRDFYRGDSKVSQEGVQRDLLPLIEGSVVQVQNFGNVKTDHVLFICAGAFHNSKPSDLMPEFQVIKRTIFQELFFCTAW